jgi:hypothetical protein
VRILYEPAISQGLPQGFASSILDPAATYLIKTNLSTESHSGRTSDARRPLADAETETFFASIAQPVPFLTLLWSCSVVGGGGYWLKIQGQDGAPLPEAIFDTEGLARLDLLITLSSQTGTTPSRRLWPFNNCAIVGDALDASAVHLFAETADGSIQTRVPSLDAGNIGFSFDLEKPPKPNVEDPASDADARLRRYYQLTGYRLLAGDVTKVSTPGLPLGPQLPESAADNRVRAEVWHVAQVIPVARYAKAYPLPIQKGLPEPSSDPYGCIHLVGTSPATLGIAQVQIWFQDMLGNASEGAPTQSNDGEPHAQ